MPTWTEEDKHDLAEERYKLVCSVDRAGIDCN